MATKEVKYTRRGDRLLTWSLGRLWAVTEEKFEEMQAFFNLLASGHLSSPPEGMEAEEPEPSFKAAARSRSGSSRNLVAMIPLRGTIVNRANMMSKWSGGTSSEKFSQQVRSAANNPLVKAIVIDVDSGGGDVQGLTEAAAVVRAAREKVKVIAVANATAGSGALWLAAQAGEFVATPSALIGSVGVYVMHTDRSEELAKKGIKTTLVKAGKFKAETMSTSSLSEETVEHLQSRVNAMYDVFLSDLAKGRSTTKSKVESDFGQGRMMMAKDAKEAGMIDRVETMSHVLGRLGVAAPSDASMAAEEPDVPFEGNSEEEPVKKNTQRQRLNLAMAQARIAPSSKPERPKREPTGGPEGPAPEEA